MYLTKSKISYIFKTIKCVNDLILIQRVFICLHVNMGLTELLWNTLTWFDRYCLGVSLQWKQ